MVSTPPHFAFFSDSCNICKNIWRWVEYVRRQLYIKHLLGILALRFFNSKICYTESCHVKTFCNRYLCGYSKSVLSNFDWRIEKVLKETTSYFQIVWLSWQNDIQTAACDPVVCYLLEMISLLVSSRKFYQLPRANGLCMNFLSGENLAGNF